MCAEKNPETWRQINSKAKQSVSFSLKQSNRRKQTSWVMHFKKNWTDSCLCAGKLERGTNGHICFMWLWSWLGLWGGAGWDRVKNHYWCPLKASLFFNCGEITISVCYLLIKKLFCSNGTTNLDGLQSLTSGNYVALRQEAVYDFLIYITLRDIRFLCLYSRSQHRNPDSAFPSDS